MRQKLTPTLAAVLCALGLGAHISQAAPPGTPQGLITGKAFLNISGSAVADLTRSPNFPDKPDVVLYPPYFEWAATGDITTPAGDWGDNYGTQMLGYFYPPSTGDYVFWICSDDSSELYLSPDTDPANKKLIAQEENYSNPREYTTSAGGSTLTMKDSSQFTGTQWATIDTVNGGAKITLQAGKAYYIESRHKEGNGGDNLSVAVQDPGSVIDSTLPIPGQYLSSDRTTGALTLVTQPQSLTVSERAQATFRVTADGTPPYSFQWRRGGTDITDATNVAYTVVSATMADNGAKFSVVVTGPQASVTSQDALLTVTPDTTPPTILSAKGSPTLTEVVLTFSEPLDPASAATVSNYRITNSSGNVSVSAASLSASGDLVTLTTASQTLGTKHTVLVSNVKDTAAKPNTIAPNSKVVFFPMGKLQEVNGFIVFEAENYDRNLDGLWVPDTQRGHPSGGVSMVVLNGGSESATQLEYDVDITQAGTYIVWFRASGSDGNSDSGWFHLDGDKPAERVDGNSDSMTGFDGALDFVWLNQSQDGPNPFTVDIAPAGPHTFGLALRENNAYFDKFILTTDTAFAPTGFGPPETREGTPGLPTVSLTAPAAGQTFGGGSNIPLAATAAGASGLDIARVDYTANGELVGQATSSPFSVTWTNAPAGIFSVRATAVDEIGATTTSTNAVVITVGTPPPQGLLVVGTASDPTLNASDAGAKARLEAQGWQVTVVQAPASQTTDADGKQLLVISSTVSSSDVGDKFRAVSVPVLIWEQALEDNFLMTLDSTNTHNTLDGQTQINIINADHPLAAGLSAGLVTVTTNAQTFEWGVPNTNAVIIATIAGDPTQAVIYGYDKGAPLIDGTPAPARRVLFFPNDDGFAAFTDNALKLFDAAVKWASGIAPKPAGGANIAWVSYHPADDTPSAGAAAAGFTRAADAGYTDLLEANGHNVTRVVTSSTPDTAYLNAFDLVIISRSLASSDYQSAPSTAAWHGIKAPMMILSGYTLRNTRLGFTTGETITDIAGPVKLTAQDPAHPIFAGVALDATETMVNVYADIVSFNGTPQLGISLNTDPLADDGKVLATIGTASDPAFQWMVIGEWQAGATMADASADVLAGHRLVFLTGSEEQATGLTSEGAGIYDLGADGAKLFLNAVKYMAAKTSSAPQLSIARSSTTITIQWTGGGTLESSGSIVGTWTSVPKAASPYTTQAAGSAQFYRVRQ